MKFTASLAAQNTSVYICDIVEPRNKETWFASASSAGTFGSGTVTYNVSYDAGVTLIPLVQDGTSTAAASTAAGTVNLRSGHHNKLGMGKPELWASIATATNPAINITVLDNR